MSTPSRFSTSIQAVNSLPLHQPTLPQIQGLPRVIVYDRLSTFAQRSTSDITFNIQAFKGKDLGVFARRELYDGELIQHKHPIKAHWVIHANNTTTKILMWHANGPFGCDTSTSTFRTMTHMTPRPDDDNSPSPPTTATAHKSLQHPNIVNFQDCSEGDNNLYMTSNYATLVPSWTSFTLLVGHPLFQTKDAKAIYK